MLQTVAWFKCLSTFKLQGKISLKNKNKKNDLYLCAHTSVHVWVGPHRGQGSVAHMSPGARVIGSVSSR